MGNVQPQQPEKSSQKRLPDRETWCSKGTPSKRKTRRELRFRRNRSGRRQDTGRAQRRNPKRRTRRFPTGRGSPVSGLAGPEVEQYTAPDRSKDRRARQRRNAAQETARTRIRKEEQ